MEGETDLERNVVPHCAHCSQSFTALTGMSRVRKEILANRTEARGASAIVPPPIATSRSGSRTASRAATAHGRALPVRMHPPKAAGYPNGMKDHLNGLALMRRGSVASIPTMDRDGKGLIAIDGTVLGGNSGGPVFVSYDESYRLLGVMYATSLVADDYGFVIKQEYVNELIEDAVAKSASELRAVANSMILKKMGEVDLERDVQRAREQVWRDIAEDLDRVRSRGN